MVQISFVEESKKQHDIEIDEGLSLMEGALKYDIPGIDGDCGGACSCATCHVYIANDFMDKIEPAQPAEEDMLDFAFNVKPNSRLSCQITVTPAMEGMIVHLPEKQF
ncbi:MAG: 2Fe-2S iron-sulfur cluster-binding protein [Pseudomonadota bacterium]